MNLKTLLLTLLLCAALVKSISIKEYCAKNKENTPCIYKCNRQKACGTTDFIFKFLTDAQRDVVVQVHNLYRNLAASGNYSSYHLKPATNMQVMSYDKECEFFAGCYIKQCILKHDAVRISYDGTIMGQNLYANIRDVNTFIDLDVPFLKKAVQNWVEKKLNYLNESYVATMYTSFEPNPRIEELTQILWGNSKFVGCAINFSFNMGKMKNIFQLLCDYKPTGNVAGEVMYKPGDAASECNGHSVDYPNLCGEIRAISQDKYQPPVNLETQSIGYRIQTFRKYIIIIYILQSTL